MKSYAKWYSMIASVAMIATLLLSTHAQATHVLSDDAFDVPALSLVHFAVDEQHPNSTPRIRLASLAAPSGSNGPTYPALLLASSHSAGFLGDAAMRKRSRQDRSKEEEAAMQEYMGYAIMITGGALVVVGGIGLLAATKAPAGNSGTVTVLGLGAMAGGGALIYYGYRYKEEAATLAGTVPRAPLMVGYAGTF